MPVNFFDLAELDVVNFKDAASEYHVSPVEMPAMSSNLRDTRPGSRYREGDDREPGQMDRQALCRIRLRGEFQAFVAARVQQPQP